MSECKNYEKICFINLLGAGLGKFVRHLARPHDRRSPLSVGCLLDNGTSNIVYCILRKKNLGITSINLPLNTNLRLLDSADACDKIFRLALPTLASYYSF
jgi:hypothetical protein